MEGKDKTIRQLTVSYLVVYRKWLPSLSIPFIRIRGQWLKECGFEPGQKIRVVVKKGRLELEVE